MRLASGETRVVGESSGELMVGAGQGAIVMMNMTQQRNVLKLMISVPWLLNHWMNGLTTFLVMMCSIWLYFCIQIFPKNLVFRKPIQLLS